MLKLVIPISFPFGVTNAESPVSLSVDTNILRAVPKKVSSALKLKVAVEKLSVAIERDIEHAGLILPKKAIPYFIAGHEKKELIYQIVIEIESSEEVDKEIQLGLGIFLLGILNVFGYARVSSIVVGSTNGILFNSRLTNLVQPGQDWFCTSPLLRFSMDKKLFDQASPMLPEPPSNDYVILNEHLRKYGIPFDWSAIGKEVNKIDFGRVFSFGKILSELIRQHPGSDYVPMIGILTAFIEGFLQINGENRYKFAIKISNLFGDVRIAPIAKKIYDSRSDFFHSGVSKTPQNIFEFARIEFLLAAIRKIFLSDIKKSIAADSFDFVAN